MEKVTQRYYSKIAGSKFIMPDGFEIIFAHGFFDLDSEDPKIKDKLCMIHVPTGASPDPRDGKPAFAVYKAELDQLIKSGNPLLYVQGKQPEALPKVRDSTGRVASPDEAARSEAELLAGTVAENRIGGRVTGDVNVGPTTTDPNASTVDPALRDAILKPNSKIEQMRAEAAARASANSGTGVAQ